MFMQCLYGMLKLAIDARLRGQNGGVEVGYQRGNMVHVYVSFPSTQVTVALIGLSP